MHFVPKLISWIQELKKLFYSFETIRVGRAEISVFGSPVSQDQVGASDYRQWPGKLALIDFCFSKIVFTRDFPR